MKINFERIGGFAGIKLAMTIDVNELPEDDANVLISLIEETSFFTIPEPEVGTGFADGYEYNLRVEDGERYRSMMIRNGAIPEKLQPLVNDLSMRARTRRRPKPRDSGQITH